MATTTTRMFTGFEPDALQFLIELSVNNDRSWFQPRKVEYERLLKEPFEALCLTLGEVFAARSIPLTADERSPFRIYRDVRFSKDKSPYKTHLAASFPLSSGPGSGHGVGGYFHFEPDHSYLGGGMWHPERPRLDAWRALVDDPSFTAEFGELEGDQLARVPTGYAADHQEAHLLRFKDVTFGRRVSDEEALSADLPDRLADSFAVATPVIRMLAELPG